MNSKSLKIDLPKNYWEVSKLYPFKIKRSFDHYYNQNATHYKTFFDENLANIFQLQKLEEHYEFALKDIRIKLKKYEKSHAEYFV